jgi:hypothetical protein
VNFFRALVAKSNVFRFDSINSFAIKSFHVRLWTITNATSVKNARPSANIQSSAVNGRDRHTRPRNTKTHARIQRVIKFNLQFILEIFPNDFDLLESGADVMAALQDREAKYNEEKKLFSCLVNLLSYEKITFNGELTF